MSRKLQLLQYQDSPTARMPVASGPSRRQVFFILALSFTLAIVFVTSFRSQPLSKIPYAVQLQNAAKGNVPLSSDLEGIQGGTPIAGKLENATAKAELGRASWKLFHTIMARFPDKPTEDDSAALKSYIHLFQRLYPCGECANHFQQILLKFPPQTSSRSAAAAWACHVHNEVNKSLDKDIFDCSNIGDFYDCGCADDKNGTSTTKGTASEGH